MGILNIETYKDYQGIKSDNHDTKLVSTINAVNSFIPSYCNRTFVDYYSTAKVEYFDASESYYYPLEFPIVSISSLKYSSEQDGNYDETLTEYTDYIIEDVNSRILAVNSQFAYPTVCVNSAELTYKAGYESYPEEITQAAVLLTEYFIEEAYNPRKSLAGASIDHVIQPDMTSRLPPHIRRILEHHKAWNW
jgi:hypothetical protein